MHANSSQQSFGLPLLELATHCVSELNDISGASSSNPVNVLTHTISDVSHRLTTASEALDARYLHIDMERISSLIGAILCMLLLDIGSRCMQNHAANVMCSSRVWKQAAVGRVMQCCTAESDTCRWGQGAGGRHAQTGHDQSRSEGAEKKGTRAPMCINSHFIRPCKLHMFELASIVGAQQINLFTSIAPPCIARYINFPSLLHNTSLTCVYIRQSLRWRGSSATSDAFCCKVCRASSSAATEPTAPVSHTCVS